MSATSAYDDPCAECGHPKRWHFNSQITWTHCKDFDCHCKAFIEPVVEATR